MIKLYCYEDGGKHSLVGKPAFAQIMLYDLEDERGVPVAESNRMFFALMKVTEEILEEDKERSARPKRIMVSAKTEEEE